jgi:hypothetical protein
LSIKKCCNKEAKQGLWRTPHAPPQAKTLCDAKTVVVYLAASDAFHGFDRFGVFVEVVHFNSAVLQ